MTLSRLKGEHDSFMNPSLFDATFSDAYLCRHNEPSPDIGHVSRSVWPLSSERLQTPRAPSIIYGICMINEGERDRHGLEHGGPLKSARVTAVVANHL